jgi:hypothetical protein
VAAGALGLEVDTLEIRRVPLVPSEGCGSHTIACRNHGAFQSPNPSRAMERDSDLVRYLGGSPSPPRASLEPFLCIIGDQTIIECSGLMSERY